MQHRLSHPSWSPDQVIGEVRGRESASQSPGVADNEQDWPTPSSDAHCLHALEFTSQQKLLARVLGKC